MRPFVDGAAYSRGVLSRGPVLRADARDKPERRCCGCGVQPWGAFPGGPGGAPLRAALPPRCSRQTLRQGSPFDFLLKVNIFGFLLVSGTGPNVGLHKSEVA